jgi:hypothetical protein
MSRYFGVGKATSWGVPVAVTDYIEILNESLSEDNQVIFDLDVSSRDPRSHSPGPFAVSGDIVFNPRPDNCGQLFAWALGSDMVSQPDPTNAPNTYEHTIKGADTLPFFTGEVGVDNPSDVVAKKYDSLMVDTVRLAHDPEGRLEMTCGLRGRSVDVGGVPGTPSFSVLSPFVFHMAQIKIAGVSNDNVEALNININNNLQPRPQVGSRFVAEYKPGPRVVDGSFDISFESADEFKRFLGGAAATTPQDSLSTVSLEIVYTSYELIEATYYYKLGVSLPQVVYTTHNANIDRRERVVEGVGFRAIYDPTSGSPIVVTLVNKDASAYI